MRNHTSIRAAVALSLFFSLCLVLGSCKAPQRGRFTPRLGLFQASADIGDVAHNGSASYNAANDTYTVTGGGENMWFDADALHYVFRRMEGDVLLAADIDFVGTGGNAHRKACLIIRQDLSPDSAYADAVVHGDGLTSIQYRQNKGDNTSEIQANISSPQRIQIEKRGNYVAMSYVMPGGEIQRAGGAFRIDFEGSFYIGLGVCAHDNTVTETAVFSDVELTQLEPATEVEDRVLYSTLETIPIPAGDRRVVYTANTRFEAPNWSQDNQLYFNQEGSLYRVPADGSSEPVRIDTGRLNRLNNDHGITPDGETLIISDQTDGPSRIYTLPIGGGQPYLVTPLAPSYWHGVSPDGQTLAYVAQRNGDYDIYTTPIGGGAETRLTEAAGLDDGPDYSPDGQTIYFNSVRTGTMQIYRMNADGSDEQQLTHDDYNDWFPHPSPDGRYLVFVSYEPDVEGHPQNRDVMLRLMDLQTGQVSVIARLFGGQGTINVPSWSPDSSRVAYVSYYLAVE